MSETFADTATEDVVADTPDIDAAATEMPDASVDTSTETLQADDTQTETDPFANIDIEAFLGRPEVQDRIGEMSQAQFEGYLENLAAQMPQAQPTELGPPPDPFESENFPAEMAAWQQAREQQLIERLEAGRQQEQHAAYVNQTISTTLDKTAEQYKIADEDKGLLQFLAEQEAVNVRGRGEEALAQAARNAAEKLQARDKRIEAAALKRYQSGVEENNGATAEPGVGSAAISTTSPANSYEDATARVLARHGIPYGN